MLGFIYLTLNTFLFHLRCHGADSAIDSVTTNLTITIEDVNDEIPSITGHISVDFDEEQSVGTIVLAEITVNDTDVGDILTFSISGMSSLFLFLSFHLIRVAFILLVITCFNATIKQSKCFYQIVACFAAKTC